MKTISDYLDLLAAREKLTSDGQISRHLGVTKQAVSRYRHKAGTPDNNICWRIAEGAGVDYSEVVATAELERARRSHDEGREKVWLDRLENAGAAMMLFLVIFLPSYSGNADPLSAVSKAVQFDSVYYVK